MDIKNDQRAALLALLQDYLGIAAPWILKQGELRATDWPSLKGLLMGALKRVEHREPFSVRFDALLLSFSSLSPIPEGQGADALKESYLMPLTVSLAEKRLSQFIGDKAFDATQSLAAPPTTLRELYEGLSLLIDDAALREQFLKLCPGER